MSFSDKMNRILEEQKQNLLSQEEMYQKCLKDNFKNMLSRIEAGVVAHGKRDGELDPQPVQYDGCGEGETPYVTYSHVSTPYKSKGIFFKDVLKMQETVMPKTWGTKGTIHVTIQLTDIGRKIFNDFRELFNNEGIIVNLCYDIWNNDYDSTHIESGLFIIDGTNSYSVPINGTNIPHMNNSVSWHLQYHIPYPNESPVETPGIQSGKN